MNKQLLLEKSLNEVQSLTDALTSLYKKKESFLSKATSKEAVERIEREFDAKEKEIVDKLTYESVAISLITRNLS